MNVSIVSTFRPANLLAFANYRLVIIGLFVFWASITSAMAKAFPSHLLVEENIVYKEVDGVALDLAMIRSKAVAPQPNSPLLVYIHGGGWASGDKYKILRSDSLAVLNKLTDKGFAVATIEYRLVSWKPRRTAYDSVVDCKDAIQFLIDHAADYSIDPKNIVVMGESAGGHLSLVTAYSSDTCIPYTQISKEHSIRDSIRCVVAFYPLTTFVNFDVHEGTRFENPKKVRGLVGVKSKESESRAHTLSPAEIIQPDSPPTFLAHGDRDKILSYKNSTHLHSIAQEKGAFTELLIAKGAGHGFGDECVPDKAEIAERVVQFVEKYTE